MKELWDKRYSSETYAYGTEPNKYFAEQLAEIKPGKLLLPAEGEGRNAVHAAKYAWDVFAFDLSGEGKTKAEKLAEINKVNIEYQVGELSEIKLEENSFDAIGLIFAHFPPEKKTSYHRILDSYLKKGGFFILEAFSKSHIKISESNKKTMGPQNIEMLFSIEEIKNDFPNYEIIKLVEEEVILSEGMFHIGKGSVIRFVGIKK